MFDTKRYWEKWAPYWSYCEDNMLNLESINRLATAVQSPVLIIGAGQGLLVEELQKKGFKVDGVDLDPSMIEYAKKRRGINLIHADARKMTFADKSYKTTIVATGVVDFMEDEEQIELTIREARRVTDDSGKVLVTFYGFYPKFEQLFKLVGVITEKSSWKNKRMLEFIRLSPVQFIFAIKKEANIGFLSAFLLVARAQMSLPKKVRKGVRTFTKWLQQVDDLESLIECSPDSLPYRDEQQIRDVFKRLSIPISGMFTYGTCNVVQL